MHVVRWKKRYTRDAPDHGRRATDVAAVAAVAEKNSARNVTGTKCELVYSHFDLVGEIVSAKAVLPVAQINEENADHFAGRIRKTKAVRLSERVALDHIKCPTLGGSDRLGFSQDRCFPVDWNTIPAPINSEHRRFALPGWRWREPPHTVQQFQPWPAPMCPRCRSPECRTVWRRTRH